MNKLFATIAIAGAAIIGAPSVSYAGFALPSIPGLGNGSAGATADLGGQQDQLVKGYVSANKDVLTANSQMAEALGLKDESVKAKATADSLTEGATKGALDDSNKEMGSSTDAVAAELKKAPQLDAAAKATFGAGLISLVSGVTKYVGLGGNVKDMATHLSSVSPLQLPKLQSAVFVVSKFPSALSSVSASLKNAVSFAQSHDIPVPADATKALAAL